MTPRINSLGMYDCKRTAIIRSHVTPGVAILKLRSTNQQYPGECQANPQIRPTHPGIRNSGWPENCLVGSLPSDSDAY